MTSRREIDELLEAVASQRVSATEAAERLATLPFRDLGFARVDTHRELRQGAPEVILGEGKTPAQAAAIAKALDEAGASSVLVTRADDPMRAAVREVLPDADEHVLARAIWVERRPLDRRGRVLIVSAGTSDGPVVHEARIRAEILGTTVTVHEDVGVAGLHRLAPVIPDLDRTDCVIVVAGMDGALASVIGGLAPCPVIGVPTSVGYGSARAGETVTCSGATREGTGLRGVKASRFGGWSAQVSAHRSPHRRAHRRSAPISCSAKTLHHVAQQINVDSLALLAEVLQRASILFSTTVLLLSGIPIDLVEDDAMVLAFDDRQVVRTPLPRTLLRLGWILRRLNRGVQSRNGIEDPVRLRIYG